MAGYRELVSLTTAQREELKRWAQSRTLPAGDVFRARLILALADGMTYGAIKRSLNTTAPTISRWKQRFEEFGIDGWEPQHKGSRPRTATPTVQAKVCRKVQQKRMTAALIGRFASWPPRWVSANPACTTSCRKHDCNRIDWSTTGRATIRSSRPKPPISSGCIWNRRSTQLYFAWTRRRRFRLWIALIPCFRFRPGEPNGTALNITGMERSRCMRPWM